MYNKIAFSEINRMIACNANTTHWVASQLVSYKFSKMEREIYHFRSFTTIQSD